MDSAIIRRYLQPSPTLRWHPWAPLVAGALLLLFAFYLGAMWGHSATSRLDRRASAGMAESEAYFRHEREAKRPAQELLRQAGMFDAAVARYLAREASPPGVLERLRDRIESVVFFHGVNLQSAQNREYVQALARFRIAEYSAANPRWTATAGICDELRQPGMAGRDYLQDYKPVAAQYSQLLGRTIRAEDLAPSVPGGKCVFQGN